MFVLLLCDLIHLRDFGSRHMQEHEERSGPAEPITPDHRPLRKVGELSVMLFGVFALAVTLAWIVFLFWLTGWLI